MQQLRLDVFEPPAAAHAVPRMTGEALRDAALQRLLARMGSAWQRQALELLEQFCAERRAGGQALFRFEEFRAWALDRGLEPPVSHHCWGALAQAAAKAGLIRLSGGHQPATSARTHAHRVALWRAS